MNIKRLILSFILIGSLSMPAVSSAAMTFEEARSTLESLRATLNSLQSAKAGVNQAPLTGATTEEVIISDVNGDGKTNAKDLSAVDLAIKAYAKDKTSYNKNKRSDLDADGTIRLEDFHMVREYLLSINDYVNAYDLPNLDAKYAEIPPNGKIDQGDVNSLKFSIDIAKKNPKAYAPFPDLNMDGKINGYDLELLQNFINNKAEPYLPVGLVSDVSVSERGNQASVVLSIESHAQKGAENITKVDHWVLDIYCEEGIVVHIVGQRDNEICGEIKTYYVKDFPNHPITEDIGIISTEVITTGKDNTVDYEAVFGLKAYSKKGVELGEYKYPLALKGTKQKPVKDVPMPVAAPEIKVRLNDKGNGYLIDSSNYSFKNKKSGDKYLFVRTLDSKKGVWSDYKLISRQGNGTGEFEYFTVPKNPSYSEIEFWTGLRLKNKSGWQDATSVKLAVFPNKG